MKYLGDFIINDDLPEIYLKRYIGSDKAVNIPDYVNIIDTSAFVQCRHYIEQIILPDSVLKIEEKTFGGCINLKDIKLSNTLESVYDHTFCECKSLKDIIIPDNIKFIDSFAFARCDSLEKVDILSEIICINPFAFDGCINLVSVNVGGKPYYPDLDEYSSRFKGTLLPIQDRECYFDMDWYFNSYSRFFLNLVKGFVRDPESYDNQLSQRYYDCIKTKKDILCIPAAEDKFLLNYMMQHKILDRYDCTRILEVLSDVKTKAELLEYSKDIPKKDILDDFDALLSEVFSFEEDEDDGDESSSDISAVKF